MSQLKKKHNAIAYHRVRESIAARTIRVAKVKSEENLQIYSLNHCLDTSLNT
jgi:hypothetical protein